jgi:hypothetical protein
MIHIIFQNRKEVCDRFFYIWRYRDKDIKTVLKHYECDYVPSKYLLIFEDVNSKIVDDIIDEFCESQNKSLKSNVELFANISEIVKDYTVYSYNKESKSYEEFFGFVPENLHYILPLTIVEYPLHECKFKFFNFEGKEVPYGEHLNFSFEFIHKDVNSLEVAKVELPILDYSMDEDLNVIVHKYTFINEEHRNKFLNISKVGK